VTSGPPPGSLARQTDRVSDVGPDPARLAVLAVDHGLTQRPCDLVLGLGQDLGPDERVAGPVGGVEHRHAVAMRASVAWLGMQVSICCVGVTVMWA